MDLIFKFFLDLNFFQLYLFQSFSFNELFGLFDFFRQLIFQSLNFIFTLQLLLDLLLSQLINLLHYNLLHLSLKIMFLFFFQHLIFKQILFNRLLEIDCLKLSFTEKLGFTNNQGVKLESLLVFIQISSLDLAVLCFCSYLIFCFYMLLEVRFMFLSF